MGIKTRVLIISDTHGAIPTDTAPVLEMPGFRKPLPHVEVLIHCGDLTTSSSVIEYANTFKFLREHTAPLKLVIAGNHDKALDEKFWRKENNPPVTPAVVKQIIAAALEDGVHYLEEGTHTFTLSNGAEIKVFASPATPKFHNWAFQYEAGTHKWEIPAGVDFAITHGPPKGILDFVPGTDEEVGCPDLMKAIQAAKPAVHCFGHIHEGWGAFLAKWGPDGIDQHESKVIKNLATLVPGGRCREDSKQREKVELERLSRAGAVNVDLTEPPPHGGRGLNLVRGQQTLFVNAAIMSVQYKPKQMPWLVVIDLPKYISKA